MKTRLISIMSAAVALCIGSLAPAQSLFRQPARQASPKGPDSFPGGTPVGPGVRGTTPETSNPSEQQPAPVVQSASNELTLKQASLTFVEAPKPKTYEVHDIVTIIISESSSQSSQQVLDAKKDAALRAAVNKFPDIALLLQANLTNTSASEPIGSVDLVGHSNFKGDGKFTRTDKFTDRIAATVIDVKPNGNLVLEARKSVGQDNEVRTVVLSGTCRREDVTDGNTVLSSQLADMTVLAHAEGDSKDTASKGILTRIADAIFNF
jgi:flagellar L-ring protein precursor FlgH